MLAKQPQRRAPSRGQIIATAIAAGIAAASLAYFGLPPQARGGQTDAAIMPVVTAAQVLPPRQLLSPPLLRLIYLPAASIPPGAFHRIGPLTGRVTLAAINAGEPITSALVATRDQATGLAPQIAPPLRAVSIPLDPAGGASGFLEAGDHVDVFAAFSGGGGPATARLIVADARLLTLNSRSGSEGGTETPATGAVLEVTPDAVQALALASVQGHLTLALRGLGDDGATNVTPTPSIVPGPGAAVARKTPVAPVTPLPPSPAPPPSKPPAPAPAATALPQITVFRGTQKTMVTVGE